ncbi:MAG: hypothetical protein MI806_34235 [Minwuiales bacterium]|nr:hypothetical protein [Minwuiales bacterium]
MTIETEEGEFFKTFEIFNPNLADLVCLVATGRGRVIDSRLSTTGVLLVEGTGTNNALRVEGTGPGDEVVVRGSEAGGEMRVIGNGPGGEVVVTGTIAGDVGSTIDSQSDLSVGTGATQVAAQNLSRLVMILKSGHTNTAPIRVGDGGVVAGSIPMNGYELLPGESVELKTTAAIFARADAPGQRLSRVEISL